VAVYNVATVDELVARSVASSRFVMRLLGLFGVLALLMTAAGVYGVIAYSVGERTREIGIRFALGASRPAIAALVLGAEFRFVLTGLAAGVALAMAGTRALSSSLYGVKPTDPPTFAVVALVLISVSLIAQAVPMARALRVEPAAALRQE
jgi:putative ABC transport system permease protein